MKLDLAAAYDALNPADDDYRFYLGLADALGARRAVDLGCGTGVLAVLLAQRGREVIAIDPDPAMLGVAGGRPGHERVTWQEGYAGGMPADWADLVTMSGHVAQVFLTDDEWKGTLREIHRGLTSGGTLAFEMRNPAARGWERWTRSATLRVVDTEHGSVEVWHQTTEVALPLVTYATTHRNTGTGTGETTLDTLRFRDETDLRATLATAGFAIQDVYGDWDRGPVTPSSSELIVIATKGRVRHAVACR